MPVELLKEIDELPLGFKLFECMQLVTVLLLHYFVSEILRYQRIVSS